MIDRHRTKKAQSTIALFLFILIIVALVIQWLDISIVTGSLKRFHLQESHKYSDEFDCSLNCSQISPVTANIANPSLGKCPEYFRWIHEDLKPWRKSGITREMVEGAKDLAHIRITIVDGRLYTEKYKDVFQTRDVVTIWGLLQLLRLYPGMIPDVDLMFECDDRPVVKRINYSSPLIPPPLFHYCSDDSSYDIVFPDWSFWGWPEVNIKPWEELKLDLKEANERIKWKDREPYAYWKGNTRLGPERGRLVKCNATIGQEWYRIFDMEWAAEKKHGFKNSDLASQCTHRYKIYVEGVSWSVSQKYILACDSMSLSIIPRYYDFFTRGLQPLIHYWPITNYRNKTCRAVKYAVEWGNKNTDKAQQIGKAGSKFIQENLAMEYIYDYSFHLLNEYAKLLKYKPTVPEGAKETCSEKLICSVKGQKRRFRKHSMVKRTADSLPCTLPPPYEPEALRAFIEKNKNTNKEVISWTV